MKKTPHPPSQTPLSGEPYFPFAFPMSRKAWRRYHVAELTPTDTTGTTLALRALADRLTSDRTADESGVSAGQLMMAGLVHDMLRHMLARYCWQQNNGCLQASLDWASARHGRDTAQLPIPAFVELYPPISVHNGDESETDFVEGGPHGLPNRERIYASARQLMQ